MKHRIRNVALILGAVFAIALSGSASAGGDPDKNHVGYWEDLYDATCVKYEPGDQSAPFEWYGKAGVILDVNNFVALVLKSALVNDVWENPTNALYMTKSGKDISHVIVCTPKEVEPSATPSAEPSDEPSPTPSAEPSVEPTPEPSPSTSPSATPEPSSTPTSEPTPTPTTSPSEPPSATPTPPSSFPAVTAPPTDTATTTPSAPNSGDPRLLLVFGVGLLLTALYIARREANRTR